MTLPDGAALYPVVEATWPPAATRRVGPWTIRDGRGGGKRVSAATAEAPVGPRDLSEAERAMQALGQRPLVMVRAGEDALDGLLASEGYRVVDPVLLHAASVSRLAAEPVPQVAAFRIWPPLAIMSEIWAAGGIGPERLAIMDRAAGSKSAILARHADRAAGVAFVAVAGATAMIHAIEVAPAARRSGVGRNILHAAAHWARDRGATVLALAVTRANGPANALYASLGFEVVGHYHYRTK